MSVPARAVAAVCVAALADAAGAVTAVCVRARVGVVAAFEVTSVQEQRAQRYRLDHWGA